MGKMEAMEILLSSFLLLLFLRPAGACQRQCSANGLDVHFPFQIINGSSSGGRCGFGPGFGLTCKNSQAVLNLPRAGDFDVAAINYKRQMIWMKDPEDCIPKRLLNFSLSDSPFRQSEVRERSFRLLSCHVDNLTDSPFVFNFWSESCVNETNYAIVAVDDVEFPDEDLTSRCQEIKKVSAPLPRPDFVGEHKGWSIELTWDNPNCKSCEQSGGTCGYKGDTGSEVGCSKRSSSPGIPRSAKYGLIIGVGIPGLLGLIGLLCFACGWIRKHIRRGRRRRLSETDFAISIGPHPAAVAKGLDGPTIESYPKTVLGESRRVPKPNDITCPICLGEYQPKDTIRTVPECNHCFHVHCVDEWLKMNATCPVCRNSPAGSSEVTPCSSVSSSTLLSSSPSSTSPS